MLSFSLQIAACHTLQHPFILELLKRLIEGSYPMLEVSVQVSVLHSILFTRVSLMGGGGRGGTCRYMFTITFYICCPSIQFELKKSLVDHLVQLLSCGHVLPVVDYVAQCTEMESLDQSHIRHFVAEVGVAMFYLMPLSSGTHTHAHTSQILPQMILLGLYRKSISDSFQGRRSQGEGSSITMPPSSLSIENLLTPDCANILLIVGNFFETCD